MKLTERIDSAQQRSRWASIAAATYKKFSQDQSTNLAAMIAFWAFFSVFPLLLVAVTVLGWVLSASDKAEVLGRIAEMFPLLEARSIRGLTGSTWALLLGAFTALWSGLGVVSAIETAFNSIWEVPRHLRPNKLRQIPRSLRVLATIGLGLVLTTLLSSFITSSANGVNLGLAGHIGGYLIAAAFDVALVIAAFRLLPARELSIRDVLPGALLTGVVFFVLQELSAFIISRHLKNAQSTYGHFATVITILWWFYLQSLVTLLGAQLNVVLEQRLFPRSLFGPARTEADLRALQADAQERNCHPEDSARTFAPEQPEAP
jgi:YihY family inner membrane protein